MLYNYFDELKSRGLTVSKLKASTKNPYYDMRMDFFLIETKDWVFQPEMRISLGQYKRIIDILFTKYFKELFPADYNFFIENIELHGDIIESKKHKISPGKTVRSKSRSRSTRGVGSISFEKMFRFITWIMNTLPNLLASNRYSIIVYKNRLNQSSVNNKRFINSEKIEFDKWQNNWENLELKKNK